MLYNAVSCMYKFTELRQYLRPCKTYPVIPPALECDVCIQINRCASMSMMLTELLMHILILEFLIVGYKKTTALLHLSMYLK